MITVNITVIPKVEMGLYGAADYIHREFPGAKRTKTDPSADLVSVLHLDQEQLTDEQRDWLHLSTFAAAYIDSYKVVHEEKGEHATTLEELRPGAIFVTQDGTFAVKSEYCYSESPYQCQCILLATGEYAHFTHGNKTLVREVHVEGLMHDISGSIIEE